jgi:hypothetical protein
MIFSLGVERADVMLRLSERLRVQHNNELINGSLMPLKSFRHKQLIIGTLQIKVKIND